MTDRKATEGPREFRDRRTASVRDRLREILRRHGLAEEFDAVMAWEDDMLTFCNDVAQRLDLAREGLRRIAAQQPETLRILQSHGIVFDGPLGADPKNWQHVAFSIYTDLCSVESTARAALDATETADE